MTRHAARSLSGTFARHGHKAEAAARTLKRYPVTTAAGSRRSVGAVTGRTLLDPAINERRKGARP
jgi:hypothetical protein